MYYDFNNLSYFRNDLIFNVFLDSLNFFEFDKKNSTVSSNKKN